MLLRRMCGDRLWRPNRSLILPLFAVPHLVRRAVRSMRNVRAGERHFVGRNGRNFHQCPSHQEEVAGRITELTQRHADRQTDRPAQPQARTAIGEISLMRAYIAADVQSVARPCSRAWANGWSFFRLRCLTRSTPTARLGGRCITCTMTTGSLTFPTTCPNSRAPPSMSAGCLHDHPRPILAWYW